MGTSLLNWQRNDVLDYLRNHTLSRTEIIYQLIEKNVYIHCILDGRRDLEDLLRIRLLRE